jgi:hypothetical protein
VDPDVQDPPSRPPDETGGLTGLRALFRRQNEGAGNGSVRGRPHVSADGGSADGASSDGASALRDDDDTLELPAATGDEAPERRVRPARQAPGYPAASRQVVNPHLRDDPRLRVWIFRTVLAIVVYFGFLFWVGWRLALTAAAVYVAGDMLFQSRRLSVVPARARVTTAQRLTRRRLKMLEPTGYVSLNTRTIPGAPHVIDHLVVGPAGVFSVDSERLDNRLEIRAKGGRMFYGNDSMESRLDHARMEADHAQALIEAQLGRRIRVQPAMVIYGPAVPWVIMRFKGVDVFDGARVGTYFRRQSKLTRHHHLPSSEIAKIFSAAAHALPPLH